MKQASLLLRVIALGALAIQITGCKKIIEHWPGHGHGHGDSTVRYRIKSMVYGTNNFHDSIESNAIFYYGADNLLDSVTSVRPEYSTRLTFEYDQNGNLKYYTDVKDFGFPLNRHTEAYGLDNAGRAITDSFYWVTSGGYQYDITSHFEYDGKGRIVKDYYTTNDYGSGPLSDTVIFNYNAQGNRGLVTSARIYDVTGDGNTNNTVYDNKNAYRSTNPIFQLIDRDYSVNNSNYATGYNSAGLPLGFAPGSTEEFLHLGEPREIEWEEVP